MHFVTWYVPLLICGLVHADGFANLRHGWVIDSGIQTSAMSHRRSNYTLYLPDASATKRVPLFVFLHDIWTTAADDRDIFQAADELASAGHPLALLRPEGNWMTLNEPGKIWQTKDFHTFWTESPWFGDAGAMVIELVKHVKLTQRVRGPVSLVGHGVGGLGARMLADQHRGEFSAVGSISGITDGECLAKMMLAVKRCEMDNQDGRLNLHDDLARKASLALLSNVWDGHIMPLPSDGQTAFFGHKSDTVDQDVVDAWSARDPREWADGGVWYFTDILQTPRTLLYIDASASDELDIYACNVDLHDKLVQKKVPHLFRVHSQGLACSDECTAEENACTDRCHDMRKCALHRPDGPLDRTSQLTALSTDAPLWTGSLKSRLVEFLLVAIKHVYTTKQ